MIKKNQVVRFMIGKESFGIDIRSVQEIVTVPEITRVPDTPDSLEGVINLRGKIVSVIDLRKRLRFNAAHREKKNRILIIFGLTLSIILFIWYRGWHCICQEHSRTGKESNGSYAEGC